MRCAVSTSLTMGNSCVPPPMINPSRSIQQCHICSTQIFSRTLSMFVVSQLWSVPSQRFFHSLNGHINWVRTAKFSNDGRLVASGGDDKTVKVVVFEHSGCRHFSLRIFICRFGMWRSKHASTPSSIIAGESLGSAPP